MAPKDESSDGVNLSRRNFLKTTGVVGLAAGVIAPAEAEAQAGPAVQGPGEVPVRLNVNGRQLQLSVGPLVPLLGPPPLRPHPPSNEGAWDGGAGGAFDGGGRPAPFFSRRWRSKCRASRFATSTASPTATRCIPCSRRSATRTR